jgi:hypothetical protein
MALTPLKVYDMLKWEIQQKAAASTDIIKIIGVFRKLINQPDRIVPKRIKNEIKGIILAKLGDIDKAYNIFTKIYQTYGKNDMFILLMITDLAHAVADKENFIIYDNLLRTSNMPNFAKEVESMSTVGIKTYITIHEGKHEEARLLAIKANEMMAASNELDFKYLYSDITEPMLQKIEGPVYTYNHIIIKDKTILILGTNKDESILKNNHYNFFNKEAIELPDGNNFFYCNPIFDNHYHKLIEHIAIYNYVANRLPDWNYYKLQTSDKMESDADNFKPLLKDTLYLHKNGFYTFVLPRTNPPALFDTYRPPDIILQEYREIMLDVYKQDQNAKREIIYMTRQVNRELANDTYMIKKLKKIYPELLVFTGKEKIEQATLFVNAKMIFGAHGAGFTNMIYCPSDCIVYEIGMKVPDNFFGSLARTFKLKYYKDPDVKINYYGKSYLNNEQFDSIILNVQRLLGDAVPHITCHSL